MIRRAFQPPGVGVTPVRKNRGSPYARGLVCWYPFCDLQSWGNAYDVYDHSGHNNTAVAQTAIGSGTGYGIEWQSLNYGGGPYGVSPGLLLLGGGSNCCVINCTDELKNLQAPMTLSVWILNYAATGSGQILTQYSGFSSHDFKNRWQCTSGRVDYVVSTSAGGYSYKTWTTGVAAYKWHFISVIVRGDLSGGVVQIFVDGNWSSDMSYSALSTSVDTSIPTVLGGHAYGGSVSAAGQSLTRDLRIWNRALSKAEISQLYIETARQGERGVSAPWGMGSLAQQYRPIPRAAEGSVATALPAAMNTYQQMAR